MKALSRKTSRAAARSNNAARTEFLTFSLAGDEYAARIVVVAEIVRSPPITEVPRAPRCVLGVASVRGRLVTVIDGRRRLGLPEAAPGARSRILLVDTGGGEFVGVMVDAVLQVLRLSALEIEPASVLGGDQPAHVVGIGRPEGASGESTAMRASAASAIIVIVDLMNLVQAVA